MGDEGYKSIAVTASTKTILFIRFQEGQYTIGHWVLVRADLENGKIYYYDSFRQLDHVATPRVISTCDGVKDLLKKAREFRGLGVIEFDPEVELCYVSSRSKKSLMVALVSRTYRVILFRGLMIPASSLPVDGK